MQFIMYREKTISISYWIFAAVFDLIIMNLKLINSSDKFEVEIKVGVLLGGGCHGAFFDINNS